MKYTLAILLLLLSGCGAFASTDQSSSLETDLPPTAQQTEQIVFSADSIEITLESPLGWTVSETRFGIILTERIRSIASEGELDGMLLHIFIDPLENVAINVVNDENPALSILNQIVQEEAYVGQAALSPPAPLALDGFSAAYYLLDNGEGSNSMVIGINVPGSSRLVTATISAPTNQAQRIRQLLPDLLSTMTINGQMLSHDALNALPTPLEFPR